MSKEEANILVVDDDADILFTAEMFLKRHFGKIYTLDDPNNIENLLLTSSIDLILLDMNFALGLNTGAEGLHWLKRILSISPDMVVIMMTAYGDIGLSVEAIKEGATDFVLKPWKNEKLLASIHSALLLSKSRQQLASLQVSQQALQTQTTSPEIIGQSASLKRLLRQVDKVAITEANILILGENGVGKELIAQQIYRQSSRANRVMLSVDLGAVPESLFESELFGHVKGAFTDAHSDRPGRFLAASGGTLFLDEIGNLPLHLQAKLLRALEQKSISPVGSDRMIPVDVRLICATNANLKALVEQGDFRADLYYRINTVELVVPPLRERIDDIRLLIEHYIRRHCKKYKLGSKSIDTDAFQALLTYHWPGNVRELAHTIERALIMSDNDVLLVDDFVLPSNTSAKPSKIPSELLSNCNLLELEALAVKQVLDKYHGNITQSAKELGITRAALYRRMKKFGF
ncbi:sigma-54-dependent transcriptional regulator [Agaribacter flavus]|uniref:Sigma-54-dependent transcriptional regulator n=1 Tax=Agaribacter flavus TaxID=1902781 RepID=A0ABV7FTY7_9ALTE